MVKILLENEFDLLQVCKSGEVNAKVFKRKLVWVAICFVVVCYFRFVDNFRWNR